MKKLSFREKWGHLSKITQQVRAEQCESPGDEDHMLSEQNQRMQIVSIFSALLFFLIEAAVFNLIFPFLL